MDKALELVDRLRRRAKRLSSDELRELADEVADFNVWVLDRADDLEAAEEELDEEEAAVAGDFCTDCGGYMGDSATDRLNLDLIRQQRSRLQGH